MAAAGSCGFTLSVFGNYFNALAVAEWNGSTRETTVSSATQLSVSVTTSDLANAGTFPIEVMNPDGTIGTMPFRVLAAPVITGTRLQQPYLIVDGYNFAPANPNFAGSTVLWNGSPLVTSWLSSTRLQALPPANTKAIAANVITVSNPSCN
jgi:hypothetical protein